MPGKATTDKKTLLVVLEQHFVRSGADVYTDVQCDEAFWDRYLEVFDHLIVCGRMREATPEDDLAHMLHSSREGVEFFGMPDFMGAAGPVKNYPGIKRALTECLERADAAIFRMPSPISMVAYPIIKKSGIPWAGEMMMNPRTAYSKESMRHPLQPVIQGFITRQTKQACLDANGVSYVTSHVLQDEYPCKTTLGRGGFTASYSTINLGDECFSMASWGDRRPDTVTLSHTGKMSDDRKGHAIFIEAVAKLRERGIDARGILIGDGPRRGDFEALASSLGVADHCDFVGWKSGFGEVQDELSRAHFFVMPTKSEGLPRAVIEAMATGLICLGNDVDGMPELLPEECLTYKNMADEYADGVVALLDNWDHALEIRRELFEKAHEYRSDVLSKRRADFYMDLRRECL